MRTSVERLRIWLLVGAGLLVVVIAGFLGFAYQRAHRIIRNLPARLGVNITREQNNFTYSQSLQGRTVFTLHAAKGIGHADGTSTLHDVNLILYGRQGNRSDRISGQDFEYDEKNGVIRALGVVHLDLQAPSSTEPAAKDAKPARPVKPAAKPPVVAQPNAAAAEAGSNSRVIHIVTSGLVFTQKDGNAVTRQQVDFAFGAFTGHAFGAQYNANTGHIVLDSAITLSGIEHGRPIELNAAHAELDRQTELVHLTNARYNSSGETAQADQATVHMRADGSADHILGDQHVRLEQAGEGVVTADHGDLALDPASKPQTLLLDGQVAYADDEPLRQGRGAARQASLHFDSQGRLQHATLTGSGQAPVRGTERVAASRGAAGEGSPEAWSTRDLTASTVDLALVPGSDGKAQLHEAIATGSAHLTTVAPAAASQTTGQTRGQTATAFSTSHLSGDRLDAHFLDAHGQAELSTVHGSGHTVLEQLAATGINQRSAGDTLDATFREAAPATAPTPTPIPTPGSKPGTPRPSQSVPVELATALQQGNVAITRTLPPSPARSAPGTTPEIQHATSSRAAYDRDADQLTLTGTVQVNDSQSSLWADRVVFERASGNSTAQGNVKVTYLQAASPQPNSQPAAPPPSPIHVIATRADFDHDADRATFYGAPGGAPLARLWQSGSPGPAGSQPGSASSNPGGSQVEAPVLIFEQAQKILIAQGAGAGAPMAVHAVLVSAPRQPDPASPRSANPKPDATPKQAGNSKPAKPDASPAGPEVVRVTGRRMVYSDALRQVEFTGGVRVLNADGDLRAQQATAYLQPAATPAQTPAAKAATPAAQATPAAAPAAGNAPLFGGNIDHIVATGHVDVTQPGRHATGERLVYTAADQLFVLTGTAAAPPRVVDTQQGTATGASLRFHSGDDSVVISGAAENASGQKPHTETKVK
jgi:lipopolysaccharide export system protein LptA